MEETIMTPELEEVIETFEPPKGTGHAPVLEQEVISEEIVAEMPDAEEGETTPEELPE